jgi:hypothetical protein
VTEIKQITREGFGLFGPVVTTPKNVPLEAIMEAAQNPKKGSLATAIAAGNLQTAAGAQRELQIVEKHAVIALAAEVASF